jgi:predicted Zn finger-like uncharacterized protein
MKFVCERCHTKYSIADDKVRQKILKIRCKTCENVITIRDPVVVHEPRASGEARGVRAVPPAPPPRTARAVEWHLAIDGRQEGPFSQTALVSRIQGAGRGSEIYVWNEQIDSWKEPRLVPELAAELRSRSVPGLPVVPPVPPPLPVAAGRRVPSPARGRPMLAAPAAAAASARRPGPHGAVEMATRPAAATSATEAASDFASEEGERTEIKPLHASLMMADLSEQAAAARPPAALSRQAAQPRPTHPPLDRSPGLHPGRSGSLPRSNGSVAPTGGSSSGLEALDLVPRPPIAGGPAAPQTERAERAKPASGASILSVLAEVGSQASPPRHPAFKFKYVVAGGLGLGLAIVVAVLALSDRDRAGSVSKPAVAEAARTGAAADPEARARAEAEKVFKSMVGERKPPPSPPAPVASKSASPSPRRAPVRPRHQEAASLPPGPLAPPPLAAAGAQPAPDGVGVARRFAQDERKVAALHRDRGVRREDGSFDHQKFMGVFKQQDHHAAIKSCYERALKRDERLKLARLDISVSVGETGSVKKVRVDAPPEFNGVSSCIREAVRHWRFPAGSGGYEASFPLILHGNSD